MPFRSSGSISDVPQHALPTWACLRPQEMDAKEKDIDENELMENNADEAVEEEFSRRADDSQLSYFELAKKSRLHRSCPSSLQPLRFRLRPDQKSRSGAREEGTGVSRHGHRESR